MTFFAQKLKEEKCVLSISGASHQEFGLVWSTFMGRRLQLAMYATVGPEGEAVGWLWGRGVGGESEGFLPSRSST